MTKIINLFPTPILKSYYDSEITRLEQASIDEFLINSRRNEGNVTSISRNVLDDSRLANIRIFIEDKVNEYFENILCPANEIEPYISLSWINSTPPGGYHHKHTHPNSIISGVFYIEAKKQFDKIYFFKDVYTNIEFLIEDFNCYNSTMWWIDVDKHDLILFPSNIPHEVRTNYQTYDRVSLSFNVFVKGNLGSEKNLTFLKL